MKHSMMLVVAFALTACAHHNGTANHASGLSHTNQTESAQQALMLRREADTLRDMAERRQREAQILANDPSVDHETVLQKRQLAQRLLEAAKEADREAASLGRQVPHGIVQ